MPSSTQTCDAEELKDLMRRLSAYFETLAAQVDALEHEISEQNCTNTPPQAQMITQLQSLDYLRQSLKDLAILMLCLGQAEGIGSLTSNLAAEIGAKLTLNDTKALVCAKLTSVSIAPGNSMSGDLDLF